MIDIIPVSAGLNAEQESREYHHVVAQWVIPSWYPCYCLCGSQNNIQTIVQTQSACYVVLCDCVMQYDDLAACIYGTDLYSCASWASQRSLSGTVTARCCRRVCRVAISCHHEICSIQWRHAELRRRPTKKHMLVREWYWTVGFEVCRSVEIFAKCRP